MKYFLLAFSFLTALCLVLIAPVQVLAQTHVAGHNIILDAGHGGTDPGSTECIGYPEADANLDIANQLKDLLTQNNAIVYMTRTLYSQTLSNNERYTLANGTDGEVLLSIHLNGSTDHRVDGSMGLYGKKK